MPNLHVAENCLNCTNLYSAHHPFRLCVTMYLANWMELYNTRWLPLMVMLAAEVSY